MSRDKGSRAKARLARRDGEMQTCAVRLSVADAEVKFAPDSPTRLASFDAAAISVLEVALASTHLNRLIARRPGSAPLLRLTGIWSPWDQGVRAPDEIKRRLQRLLDRALETPGQWSGEIELLAVSDKQNGQLTGNVIVVDGERLEAFWGRMVEESGGTKSRDGREVETSVDRWQTALGRMLESLPQEYEKRRLGLAAASDAFRTQVAQALEPALNSQAASLPHATYEEKKHLAKWVNAELRRFGLAIKCPNTGKACLMTVTPGRQPQAGRFVLDYTDESGKRFHPFTSGALFYIRTTLADLTRLPYGQRTQLGR